MRNWARAGLDHRRLAPASARRPARTGRGRDGAAIAGRSARRWRGFYAFEIVIGAYTPAAIAPVAAATLTGVLVAQMLGRNPIWSMRLRARPC